MIGSYRLISEDSGGLRALVNQITGVISRTGEERRLQTAFAYGAAARSAVTSLPNKQHTITSRLLVFPV